MLLFQFIFYFVFHPLHLSLCEVKHNVQNSSLEISHKIFIDDLEVGMEKHFGKDFHLASPKENPEEEKYLEKYIREHFFVKINGQNQTFQYWGREYDNEAVWVYLEIYNIPKIKDFEVKNTILVNSFYDQTNILNLNYENKVRTLRFKKDFQSDSLNY